MVQTTVLIETNKESLKGKENLVLAVRILKLN